MISILVIADAHIGRYPTKVPQDNKALAVRAVWRAAVNFAIEEKVDAVALTGDIVDQGNKYFEAYGALKRGVERLAEEGIEIFAVAGNHDYDVFPQLVDDIQSSRLHLLGRRGVWDSKPLVVDGKVAAWFTGWSFPSAHFDSSPLQTFPAVRRDTPVVGIVHGDLKTSGSRYAPLPLSELRRLPPAAWLLGHIHRPQLNQDEGAPVLYPGSLQPLDPGEPGIHGPWLLQIDTAGEMRFRHVPLASVRYQKIAVDVTGNDSLETIKTRIATEISRKTDRLGRDFSALRHVSWRIVLTGTSPLHRTLSTSTWSDQQDLETDSGQLRASIDHIEVETAPLRNLENIARFQDPPGTVANWLHELQRIADGGDGSPVASTLVDKAMEAMQHVTRANKYRVLDEPVLDRSTVAALLLRQGMLMVDTLMAQKEKSHE